MNQTTRNWLLGGLTAALAVAYVIFFTDWLSPVPIEVASQVRPVIQQPRFGRRTRPLRPPADNAGRPDAQGDVVVRREDAPPPPPPEAVRGPEENKITDPPNGVAHVTFSLDAKYALTSIRVFALGDNGERGKMMWDLSGKSRSLNALIYGMNPAGMTSPSGESTASPLEPGTRYRLEIASGRRKGTNLFQTINRPPPTE